MFVTPQRRTLGRTGESVSCIGLGGSHIGGSDLSDNAAIALIRRAVDNGLNFLLLPAVIRSQVGVYRWHNEQGE